MSMRAAEILLWEGGDELKSQGFIISDGASVYGDRVSPLLMDVADMQRKGEAPDDFVARLPKELVGHRLRARAATMDEVYGS